MSPLCSFRAGIAACSLALAATLSLPAAFAQGEGAAAVATTIVTALPKGGEAAPPVPQSSFTLKVDGKAVQPTIWQPYGQGEVQLVLLIDNSLRTSFARNLEDLANFINALPPNISIGIAYMQNGAALFNQPFTKDHAAAAKTLHIPAGTAGSNASPYFCLQDLARRWPAAQSGARREVMMITDGVDEYNLRYDPEDPYVRAAVDDSNRSGMVVFPVYFRDQGRLGNSRYETDAGQNYLFQVADATGGNMYYEGLSNPVSLTPFLQDLTRRLQNQYELGVPVKPEKKVTFADLKLKTENGAMKLKAANRVVVPAASTGPM